MTGSKKPREKARFALVTGAVGAGKTTVVSRVLDRVREGGRSAAGLWCPAHRVGGSKGGIRAVDLASGEDRLLAVRTTGQGTPGAHPGERCLHRGPYTFDPEVFAWANGLLLRAIKARPDLLVVDEIGPMELERGAGLAKVLEALATENVPRTLVVVRDRCLEPLRARLSSGRTGVFTVDENSRASIPETVSSWLFSGD